LLKLIITIIHKYIKILLFFSHIQHYEYHNSKTLGAYFLAHP